MDDPTECKVAYLVVVSHPAGETVAHLIDKFLQRRFAQRLWFAWFRSRLRFGYVVAALARSVPPHPFRGGHRLRVRVTNVTHVRNGSTWPGWPVTAADPFGFVPAHHPGGEDAGGRIGGGCEPVGGRTVGLRGERMRMAAGVSAALTLRPYRFVGTQVSQEHTSMMRSRGVLL